MTTRLLFGFLTLLVCITAGCKKETGTTNTQPTYPWQIQYDSLGLPLLTQEGKGAFGFLLNGATWKHGCSQGAWIGGNGSLYVDKAHIATYNYCEPTNQRLVIILPSQIKAKEYPVIDSLVLSHYISGFDAHFVDISSGLNQVASKTYTCGTKSKQSSFFNVEYHDPERSIISGRFKIVLYRSINGDALYRDHLIDRDSLLDFTDSIVISDGRFDLVQRN